MVKSLLITVFLLLAFFEAAAADLAMAAGPISFFPLDTPSAVPDGLYAQLGLRTTITPRIEGEITAVTRMTPNFAETIGLSVLAGFNLLGPSEPLYFNMAADFGLLCLYETESQKHHQLIHLRITPLMIGNPYYVERGRLFTIGGLYDLSEKQFIISFSTVMENWFLW